jgi:hypothetical protein
MTKNEKSVVDFAKEIVKQKPQTIVQWLIWIPLKILLIGK